MFRSKKEVDRHVKDIFLKLKNEQERNLRCYNIAKLYYQVGDYESAKRYVSIYLEIREGSVGAHKLLGQALEALGQKEAALQQYTISLELEARQDDLVLKICELLADMDVSMDINKVRHLAERADKQFPHHPTVFQLKEKMLTVERPNDNSGDLEALITSELSARPMDVHLRVKLLKHYIAMHRLDDAYSHAAEIEATHSHRNSTVWYQALSELLTKCKESKQSEWSFWILYISVLERYAALCLKEQGNEIKKTVPEATQAVFNFDQSLNEFKLKNLSNNPSFTDHMLLHMWGQLHYHLACLFLQKTKREPGSWSEAGRLCMPLLLTALHVTPIDPTAAWAIHLKDRLKSQIRLWYKEGSYRCSQSGHVLQDYGGDDAKKLLDKIDKFCTSSWRKRVYQRIFVSRVHQQSIQDSHFSNNTASNPPLRLCSYNELKRYDEISEEVWPDSLHHQIWLGLKMRHHSSHNKESGPHPNYSSHLFPELQFSVYNLNQAAPDSLSRLDIDAFLNAAIFCASAVIDEQHQSGFLTPDRLPTLPADLTSTLCSCTQEKWWSSAYKMYFKQEAMEGDIGEIRQELQRGLEVVRCIGNHGLHPALIVHLARIFHHRVKVLKEKDKDHSNTLALEARCELYWSNAVPLLERLQNNQTIRITNSKLFNYQGKEMNNAELTNALEEGKLLLVQRFLRDKQYEQAIEALQALKCPEASFQQGQIYKMLADEIVSSMPRESLTSEMRSQHIIMLSKARNCLYLTLDRLRSPGTNPKHPLNSELCTHIADIENELKRIDPDLSRGDLSRNECDGMSDESYSSAHSAVDQPITSVPLTTLTSSVNMLSTPQRNTHRAPKQSSTPCRPQHLDILDLTRNRTEARPSPERLDAQIRQMIHSRDNIMQTIVDQNKTVLESHKALMEKMDELTKEVAELRKENQKQRAQSLPYPNNLIEDQYLLSEEDYNELNYNANQQGAASSISGNMFTSLHKHPYSPLVYPSANAFQGYYQGGIPFTDPNAQTIPSLYPPSVYPMPVLYPNTNARTAKIPENIVQQSLFTSRLPEFMAAAANQQPMQIPLQKVDTPSTAEAMVSDTTGSNVPPANIAVTTTTDTLPSTVTSIDQQQSLGVPPSYRVGATSTTSAGTEQSNVPHCYQISMPSQATIPTTVNLPPLATTLTTTPASMSMPETPKTSNTNICSIGSPLNSSDVVETEVDPIPDFVPIIPLPAEVKVTTGEEDECSLYRARAKLFRFVDGEWKERGVGHVKLLRNAQGKVRLLMRRDQVLKICANHLLRPDMELLAMPNNDKAWIWVANDFADEEVKLEKLCIKFKTSEEALSFKEHFDKAKLGFPEMSEKVSKTPTEAATILERVSPEKEKAKAPTTTAVVGGFSFTSKPIIQKVTTTESSKTKLEETAKPSPFAGFTFNMTANDSAGSAATKNAVTVPSTSQAAATFSFGKAATPAQSETTSISSSGTNVNAGHSTLRRPHAPPPASAVGGMVGVQDSNGTRTESEEVLYEGKAVLQYYNNDMKRWNNKGPVKVWILLDSKSGGLRILMIDESTSQICYNYKVLAKMQFKTQTAYTAICWSVSYGKENKEGRLKFFNATFNSTDQGMEFYKTITQNQKKMVNDCVLNSSSKKAEATSQNAPSNKNQTPLAELFKPAVGSWECSACYTRNTASDGNCLACKNPAPAASNKPASAVTSTIASTATSAATDNKIPLSQLYKTPAGSWECKGCYIVNTSSNNYCVACDTPKDPSLPPKPKTNSFQIGTPSTGATFSFGIPPEATKEAAGGFTFRLPTSNEKVVADSKDARTREVSPKPDNSSGKFVFGSQQAPSTPTKKDAPFAFGSPGFGFNFVAKSPVKSPGGGGANSEEEVVESDDIYFLPIVPLPDKIEVKTGEEDEEVLYSHRAKLFRFDSSTKEWKERGLGDIKLLRHKDTNKLRLIMRRDQILKLCLNHYLLPDLEFSLKDDKTWHWNAGDYSEGAIEYMHFACRFKTAEIAEGFMKAVDDARKGIKPQFIETVEDKTETPLKSSPTPDIEVLYEKKVTAEEKAAALKLQLPENFYAYKQKPDCPGCIGCREPSVPLFDDTNASPQVSPNNKAATQFSPSINKSSTPNEIKSATQASDLSSKISMMNVSSPIFKTNFSTGSTAQFPQSSISSSFDTSTMSFGNSDSSTFNDKKTGFSFRVPQIQTSGNDSQKSSASPTIEKQNTLLAENLKICSPNTTQAQQGAHTAATSPLGITFTGLFGSSQTENLFGLNSGKNMFGGSSKKESSLIKPSSFNVSPNNSGSGSIFSNNLNSSVKSAASETTTSSTFGSSPASGMIFGTPGSKTDTQTPTDSTVSSSFTSNTSTTNVFGIPPGTPIFGNTPTTAFSFNLLGTNRTTPSPFGTTNTTTTNIFDAKLSDNATQKESEGVSFLPTNDITFSTLAANAAKQEAFKIDPNFSFAGAGSSVFGTDASMSLNNSMDKRKGSSVNKKKDQNEEEEGDENENDEGHDPQFEPIVPLPDVVEVRTGEEDEEKVFCERAKLYRFTTTNDSREWKERGVGEMKILHHTGHDTYRLLLRRDQVHKVVCNFLLTPDIEFHPLLTSDRAWIWAGMNHAEDQPCVEELAVRFKTPELAAKFKDTIDKAQQSLSKIREEGVSDVRSEEQEVADEEDEEEDDMDEDEYDEEDDRNSIIFEKRATLMAKTGKETKWKTVALGNLIIYYDSNICCERIILKADESDEVVSNTITNVDTQIQVEGKECIWTAIDYALEPVARRTLKAVFSSPQAAQQMYNQFLVGLQCEKDSDITEQSAYE